MLGWPLGCPVGDELGYPVGCEELGLLGTELGSPLGLPLGCLLGCLVGNEVVSVGW